MSRRNRTTSYFRPRNESSFSKTAYMYPNQRNMPFRGKPLASTNASFFQEKQRSLNNSVLDYKHKGNESMHEPKPFVESASVEDHHQKLQKKLDVGLQRPMTGQPHHANRSRCIVDDENFRKTKGKLMDINFNHHDPEMCVCAYCTCGRHLCKMHIIKPDLHNFTTYRSDYNDKQPLQNLRFRPTSSHKDKGPHMDMNSTYGKDFDGKSGDLERPRPEDCLGVGGPLAGLTTYSSGFPGYKGDNQYVKPTNNTHLNGMLPFNGNSIYRKSYVPKLGGPGDLAKWSNHFKNGEPWLGNTTYRNSFKEPNSDDYASRSKILEKREVDPDYSHQYQTTYKNDFLNQGNGVCPAKIELQTKMKGRFGESKANFNENSDYKAMSPDFHAISTSRHSRV